MPFLHFEGYNTLIDQVRSNPKEKLASLRYTTKVIIARVLEG